MVDFTVSNGISGMDRGTSEINAINAEFEEQWRAEDPGCFVITMTLTLGLQDQLAADASWWIKKKYFGLIDYEIRGTAENVPVSISDDGTIGFMAFTTTSTIIADELFGRPSEINYTLVMTGNLAEGQGGGDWDLDAHGDWDGHEEPMYARGQWTPQRLSGAGIIP